MNTTNQPVITRFAPSPTGFLHIGGVRTAIFAYLYAKQQGGEFILRIEDTDKNREVEGSIEHIMESLRWLGIDWDYGPDKPGKFKSCLQSDRLDIYNTYAQKLIDKGLAYPDPRTNEELEAFRELAQLEKRPFLVREHRPETFDDWDGSAPLRFKVPELKRYTWHDEVRGELSGGAEMLDDMIIIKADGYPTYNFAHIIDDLEMGVTHVMRGDEFISSTPKFLSLYDALEIPYPKFVTLPPIMRDDGKKKLSKRDGVKDILDYREDGILPETMLNFLSLIGWNPGTEEEKLSVDELTEKFKFEKIQKSGGSFNIEKLNWLNKEYLKDVPDSKYAQEVIQRLSAETKTQENYSDELIERLVPTLKERIHTYKEAVEEIETGEYAFALSAPEIDLEMVAWKKDESYKDALPRLQKARELLTEADFSSPDTIKDALWDYAEEIGKGEVLWPIRVSLTGLERSPDPFSVAFILGKPQTLSRLETICDKMSS